MPLPYRPEVHTYNVYSLALPQTGPRREITASARRAEAAWVAELAKQATVPAETLARAQARARELIGTLRTSRGWSPGVDALMHEFSLGSDEGVALMCLAEALLRIPDQATADKLIRDKLARGQWENHLGRGHSLFVNAATWGLVVSRKVVDRGASATRLGQALTGVLERLGEPVIRGSMRAAMRFLGDQFVAGETIEAALHRAKAREAKGFRFSYDMLGEAALTRRDALAYFGAYLNAIHAIGQLSVGMGPYRGPSVSVKLSALHPRYTRTQRDRVVSELLPRLKTLAGAARQYDIGFSIDAEESDRIDLSLDLLEMLAADPELAAWQGLGFVVQAYQKRAPLVIDHLADLARRNRRRLMVRLVKGAYWDSEIKRAQVDGTVDYPVFTRKAHTDVSYIACAKRLLECADALYPQFATHNAMTLALVEAIAGPYRDYEFQALHGMGEPLYDLVAGPEDTRIPCRIYAPVGTHDTLLAYLVRRLLENGANSSFVSQMADASVPIDTLVEDPVARAERFGFTSHPLVPVPAQLFPDRRNSRGLDLANELELAELEHGLAAAAAERWTCEPIIAASSHTLTYRPVVSPADFTKVVGRVAEARPDDVDRVLAAARSSTSYPTGWSVEDRAIALTRAGDRIEANLGRLVHLIVHEAGRTFSNAIAEVREAADFCRYYAGELRKLGECEPLGIVACISPWNFPLSIFVGQIAGALAAGNAVIAKPAEETPLIACEAVRLLLECGVPPAVLQFLPGKGETVGAALVADPRVQGVVFTGSTEVARGIARVLAERGDVPLIAETGGINAMIVDSSALPEQVVADVITSAFDSAGQRCSALRLLCLQEEIADKVLRMLAGAMSELRIGPPDRLATDIGPIITAEQRDALVAYVDACAGRVRSRAELSDGCEAGSFFPPTVVEIANVRELEREIFGPVLHVIRYKTEALDDLVDAINATGFGLTFGVQSRVDDTIERVVEFVDAGNIYVNRNMVGAVVGVQPFGGGGLSGTGPKAGGPFYLWRLARRVSDPLRAPVPSSRGAQLHTWASRVDDPELANVIRHYADRAAMYVDDVLTGPTGEHNAWSVRARGRVACLGEEEERWSSWVGQICAAVASGNEPVVVARTRDSALWTLVSGAHDAGLAVATLEQDAFDALASAEPFDAVLVAGSDAHVARVAKALADRPGPLVPLVATRAEGWSYPLWRLVRERVVSINTTATGGNAELLAEVG